MAVSYSGAGTDIFIRKVRPGAAVGVGYFFDVYENGIKIESTKIDTKKHVLSLIKDYKEKYHTNRAFENELQVHITYKTKEERGEFAMQSLDQELLKKANSINIALQKLISPDLPIKVREAELAVGNNVDFIPTTPGGTEGMMDEAGIGATIATKFVEFISGNQPQQGQEWVKADNLYNPLKKWLTAIAKKIKEFEQTNNAKLDRNKISDIAEQIILSGDPGLLQSKTQIQVSPEVATKIKEIASMKAGIRKPSSAPAGGPPEAAPEEPPKMASITEELTKIADELDGLDKDEGFGDDSAELDFNKLIQTDENVEDALLLPPDQKNDITSLKTSFFDYVKNINRIASLNDVFADWSNRENLDYIISKQLFSAVNDEINQNFCKKKAWGNLTEDLVNNLLDVRLSHEVALAASQALSSTEATYVTPDQLGTVATSVISDPAVRNALSDFLYSLTRNSLLEQQAGTAEQITQETVDSVLNYDSLTLIENVLMGRNFLERLAKEIKSNLSENDPSNIMGLHSLLEISKEISKKLVQAFSALFNSYKEKFKTHEMGVPAMQEQPE